MSDLTHKDYLDINGIISQQSFNISMRKPYGREGSQTKLKGLPSGVPAIRGAIIIPIIVLHTTA